MSFHGNPWTNIQSLYELQYFICPACPYRNNFKQEFMDHVCQSHPEAIDVFKTITDGSISDVSCPWNDQSIEIKSELYETNDYIQDDFSETNLTCLFKCQIPCKHAKISMSSNINNTDEIKQEIVSSSPNIQKNHHCGICGKSFTIKSNLRRHIRDVHLKNGEKIDNTNSLIGNNNRIDESDMKLDPTKQEIEDDVPFDTKCSECDLEFKDRQHKKDHIMTIHQEKMMVCAFCNDIFLSESELISHSDTHHSDQNQDHIIPDSLYENDENIDQEEDEEKPLGQKKLNDKNSGGNGSVARRFKCGLCVKAFSMKNNLRRHIRLKHMPQNSSTKPKIKNMGEKIYQCDFGDCGKRFSFNNNLRRHLRINHGLQTFPRTLLKQKTEKRSHQCEQCGRNFSFRNNFNRHMRTCGMEKNYSCTWCGKAYLYEKSLSTHLCKKNPNQDMSVVKSFQCDQCGKEFSVRSNFKRHIREVHGSEISCEKCGKTYRCKNSLKNHVEIAHEGVKKYTCSYCGETFGRSHCLQTHVVNYHEPEKKLKCQRCPKAFPSSFQLTKHVEIVHEGIKRFKCEKCDRPFGTKNTLERHISVVHEGLKPYECPHCTQAYGQSNDLYKHIRKVHQMPTNQKSYGTKLKPLHDLSRD